jgi:hypothetical protein
LRSDQAQQAGLIALAQQQQARLLCLAEATEVALGQAELQRTFAMQLPVRGNQAGQHRLAMARRGAGRGGRQGALFVELSIRS